MARCTQCGASIKAGAKSCEYCGSGVDRSPFESVLGFVEERAKRRDEAARAAQAARAEAARIAEEQRPKALMALALMVVACMLVLGVMALYEHWAERNTVAVPEAASELKGDNYQDVETALRAAGFTSIETSANPDLILGWLNKDGEVEAVSVNGSTDFSADSRFPIDAKVVIRYHTFPETESETAAASPPAANEKPLVASHEADDTVLTPENNQELKAVLEADNPGDPHVAAFIAKYAGRTIEFNGYTWDWLNEPGYETIYTTNVYVGDVKNADNSSIGPIFRVERYQWPNFVPELNRMNVHVKATVDGYDAEHEFFMITPTSIEGR